MADSDSNSYQNFAAQILIAATICSLILMMYVSKCYTSMHLVNKNLRDKIMCLL